MRGLILVVGCLAMMATCAQATTPEEEAIKILSLGWKAYGAGGTWGEVRYYSCVLECKKQAYCALVAYRCDDMDLNGGPLAEGKFRTMDDKRQVPWSCRSLDGKTGIVTIDGKKYDLANGRLFVVCARMGKMAIFQLSPDLGRVSPESVGVNALVAEESKKKPPVRAALKTLGLPLK
jgi:hypothetical protein